MTDEKNLQEAKVRSGLSAKRNPVSVQVTRDIIIPAGTLLRDDGDDGFVCAVGTDGSGFHAELTVRLDAGAPWSTSLKRVIAA